MRHDLRDALDELRPEAIQVTVAVAAEEQSGGCNFVCKKCGSPPAHNDKLRYCGRCATILYCSKRCAKEHWAEHKFVCDSARKARGIELAAYEARGGRKQDFNQMRRDAASRFTAVPGLISEIQLLAWTHRGESPFIHAIATSKSNADGSDIRVEMMPRSFWDEDPRFLEAFTDGNREQLRHQFGEASFCSRNEYLCLLSTVYPDGEPGVSSLFSSRFDNRIIRGAEIAEALTTATKAEDLADAFAWFENVAPTSEGAQEALQYIRNRASSVHGDTTLQGSVPNPSRALNHEVAYVIFDFLYLEFDVRLMGLRGAAHLNGRQGIIRCPEPGSHDRWKVRLDDSKYVSVKAVNLTHIRQGDYRRRSPWRISADAVVAARALEGSAERRHIYQL